MFFLKNVRFPDNLKVESLGEVIPEIPVLPEDPWNLIRIIPAKGSGTV
jgi:hypothetical protein